MKSLIISVFILLLFASPLAYAAQDYISTEDLDGEVGSPTLHDYRIDIDNDGKKELIKVIYGAGVSDKPLTIEVYKDGELISTLKGEFGIQSNYKIEDVDNDGKKEIIIWSGLWDFRMAGEDGVTEETYEGHSAPHRYIVATYKLLRGEYYLWDIYTTKKKYEPFCEQQPRE